MTLNNVEKECLIEFLEDLRDNMGNAGCNDYCISADPQNEDFIKEMNKFFKDELDGEDIFKLSPNGEYWLGYDWAVLLFLKNKIVNNDV
jgi:hypothetical protein